MEQVLIFFKNYSEIAIIISIFINVIISVLGVIPSFFLTGANITFFGFWYGTLISFLGESIGSVISFFIYRKGFKTISENIHKKDYGKVKKLLDVKGVEAFYLILSFRLFPFIPSGIVNVFAALGKVTSIVFIIASSIGKIPALLIEAYSVKQITEFNNLGKTILIIFSVYFLIIALKKIKAREYMEKNTDDEVNIEIRELKRVDLHCNFLKKFNRYQITNRVWYKERNENDKYILKDDYFIDTWDEDRKIQIVEYLRECIGRGGLAVGAYYGNDLIGFANIESELVGTNKEYLELPFIHVSNEFRDRGIGKKLFKLCSIKAKEKGAKKLYIGAHPSVETQDFYKSIGCTYAVEINKDIFNREPLDIQMEYVL